MKNYINKKDAEQRAIILNSLDKNMFVEAGAGAGKTTTIVNRIMAQFLAGIMPERIVVITFTNAAAEELRSRIVERLAESVGDGKIDNVFLENVDKLNISTIHSFCNKILSEQSFAASIPVGAKLIEQEELIENRTSFLENWIANLTADEWSKICPIEERSSAKNAIAAMFKMFDEAGEDKNIVLDVNMTIGFDTVTKDAKDIIVALTDAFNDYCDKQKSIIGEVTYASKTTKGVIECRAASFEEIFSEYWDDYDENTDLSIEEYINILENLSKNICNKSNKWFKETGYKEHKDKLVALNNECIEKVSELNEKVKNIIATYNDIKDTIEKDEKYRHYARIAVDVLAQYRKNRNNDELTNNTLLYKMNELMSDINIRQYYAKRYSCFYVDEFQDTDNVQADFIWKLASDPSDISGNTLRDGALFLVGDPKQSIYRFRGAEPEVFFEIKEKMEKLDNAEVFFLSRNHRSNNKVLEWVHEAFKNADMVSNGNYQRMDDFHILPQVAIDNPKVLTGFYDLSNIIGDKVLSIETDSQVLVKLIHFLKENDYMIYDWKAQAPRPLKYSDFLVIFDNHQNMKPYIDLFVEEKIPVNVLGEISVDSELSVKTYIRIYDAIAGTWDKKKYMGAIEALRLSGVEVSTDNGESIEEATYEYYSRFIDGLRKKTMDMNGYGKAEYLLKHLELLLPKEVVMDNFRVKIISARIEQMLEMCSQDSYYSADSLSARMKKFTTKVIERELSLVEDEDAVRIMNLHKAKGLEGKIVIFAKRDSGRSFKYEAYSSGKDYYPAYSTGKWISYKTNEAIYDAAQKEYYEEVRRLEYVAATRAEEAFIFLKGFAKDNTSILFGQTGAGENVPYESIDFTFEDIMNYESKDRTSAAICEYVPDSFDESDNDEKIVKELKSPSHFEMKGSTKTILGEDVRVVEELCETNRPKGNIVGNILHRSFELAVSRTSFAGARLSEQKLYKCVKQAILENRNDIPDGEEKHYEKFMQAVIVSGMAMYEREGFLKDKAEINTELQFAYSDVVDGKTVIYNGFADVVIIDKQGKVLILDYKSDAADTLSDNDIKRALEKKYSPQIDMYKEAVSRLYGISINDISAKLIYFRRYDEDSNTVDTCLVEI